MQPGDVAAADCMHAMSDWVRAPAGLDFVFHMFFLVKYCKSLEEGESFSVHSMSS